MVPGTIFSVRPPGQRASPSGVPGTAPEVRGAPIGKVKCPDRIYGQPSRKSCQLFRKCCQPSRFSGQPTCVTPDTATKSPHTNRNRRGAIYGARKTAVSTAFTAANAKTTAAVVRLHSPSRP